MTSQALTTLQQAVAADPDNADLRHLLGAHCAQNRDDVQTEREQYRAVSLNPLAHVARLQFRRLYLTENDPHRSISTWLPLDAPAERTALKSFKRGLEAMIRARTLGHERHLRGRQSKLSMRRNSRTTFRNGATALVSY
jgi:hypothetical protein